VRIRELALDRERENCRSAESVLESKRTSLQSAVEEHEKIRMQYRSELTDVDSRFRSGRITASTMVSALNACEQTKAHAQKLEIKKKKCMEQVADAQQAVDEGRERVQRATYKIESLTELVRRTQVARNQAVELKSEQDVDEQAILRSNVTRNCN
jgi:hypothetical protein